MYVSVENLGTDSKIGSNGSIYNNNIYKYILDTRHEKVEREGFAVSLDLEYTGIVFFSIKPKYTGHWLLFIVI